MKTKLFTKNIFGLLMTLVLAFGVQGIADAADLQITKGSGDRQTKPTGNKFEITFSVTERSNTTAIKNNDDQLVTESGKGNDSQDHRINSAGFPVRDIGNFTGSSALRTTSNPTFTVKTDEELKVKNTILDSYTDRNGTSVYAARDSEAAYDEKGFRFYSRKSDGTGTPTALSVTKSDISNKVPLKSRYHYNEEKIKIEVDKDSTGTFTGESNVMTFKLKASTHQRLITSISEDPDASPNALQGSFTLICDPISADEAGTYTIRIIDDTPLKDTPWSDIPDGDRSYIEFTLYVTSVTDTRPTIMVKSGNQRILTAAKKESVNDRFTFSSETSERIHYQVTKGSGKLYVGNLDNSYTDPAKDLLTHQTSSVYINMNKTTNEVTVVYAGQDPRTYGVKIVFEYTGRDRVDSDDDSNGDDNNITRNITVSSTSISGAPGTTQSLTVSAGAAAVRLQGAAFTAAGGTITGTGAARSLTLPNSPGSTYLLTASASGYVDRNISVTVNQPQAPGTLTLTTVGARVGTQQQIRVTASGRDIPSGGLVVTLSGVALPRTVTIPSGSTSTTRIVTLPSATSAQTVSASATGYNASNTLSIPAPGSQPPTTGQQPTPTTGTASRVQIRSEAFPSGSANTQLAQPLAVRVLDANGNGVRNVRVTFEVTAGNGRLSQRGNGRATRVQTNASGQASTPYTPLSASSTVRAKAAGVSQTVTFTITGSGAATTTPTQPPSTVGPPTAISPVVYIAAAQRPPMLWVEGGKIYALVGSDVQSWSPSVDNAQNITVAGDKVYWTEKTGESGGTINAANLDGTGVKEITTILATPTGIAVDTTARRIYVVNTGGRILSMNLDGSRIQTVLQNLSNPKDIAVSGGTAYWTQDTGAVRFVNLSGTKNVRSLSTGADAAVSLVISGNKVYWTEQTGESGGTINSANLNGTGVTRVASILAAPTGIAVDAARSKLYVTNTGGRILRMNLNGSYIQTVADGLGMPGDMVISNSIKAPAATPTTPTTTTPTASGSKYDLNADGSVDSTDVELLLLAISAGVTLPKHDVNGDTKVDIQDVIAVNANLDKGAASAPTLLGTKFSALEINRLQEQIDLLIATGDRSPAAIKTLIYLQQLIVMARPEKTQLLANYPNPFNPETWIPYELATDTEVRITIYNAQGVVIRTLQLGQQSAGYYTDRERAAYWDGRNALGEQVASGIYFYQFETDEISSLRKMVILK